MSAELPPQPSPRVKAALAVVLVATLAYSVVIAGQILLWFILAGIAAGVYVAWLLVVAVFRMVEAVERIATAMEADGSADDREDGRKDGDEGA